VRPADRVRITGATLCYEQAGDLRETPDVIITNKFHEAVSLLRKQKLLAQIVNIHYKVHKNPQTAPPPRQMNPLQNIPSHE
jgi:DeoR/GlpR family transcriptional regulator of sugar metabolism